jgi:hypothetical protein
VRQRGTAGKGGLNYRVRITSGGVRLVQHGVVLSEIRRRPGPTHSVFDVLAALAHVLAPGRVIGLLGFAGGSLLAPLRLLSRATSVHAVDLDDSGYNLFKRHCSGWAGDLIWQQVDAVRWLRPQQRRFAVLIDDLSVLADRRVIKPEISTTLLPGLMRSKLTRDGVAISNLLRPVGEGWGACLSRFTRVYQAVHVVHLEDFENRIVLGGARLPPAVRLSHALRGSLERLSSRQYNRVHVHTLR